MKKLWITLWITMVVVSILAISVAFIVLGEANDSSLAVTSQAIEKIQHNTEASDNFMTQMLEQERHFVETSFITISIIITVVIILFSLLNFKISKDMLDRTKEEMRIEYKKEFEKLRIEYTMKFNNLKYLVKLDFALIFQLQSSSMNPESAVMTHGMAIEMLADCPRENKVVQERIIVSLDKIHELAPQITLDAKMNRMFKDTLNKYSEYPFLKDKLERVKEALKIDC